MPFSAPLPVPTIMAVGVARPRAHGQDITSTAIPIEKAKLTPAPERSHIMAAAAAIHITTGTKTGNLIRHFGNGCL